MLEQVCSQLQMRLLQQSGPEALPLGSLSREGFLEFIRKIEEIILNEKLAPIMVYWSSKDAQNLLPTGKNYRSLQHEAFCLTSFSGGSSETLEEWCFLVESKTLCLVLHGQQATDSNGHPSYQCVGCVDPPIVRECFIRMLSMWQSLDLEQCNRLEDAVLNLGEVNTLATMAKDCRQEWLDVKTPPEARSTTPLLADEEDTFAVEYSPTQQLETTNNVEMAYPELAAEKPIHVFPLDAQEIINEIFKLLRHSNDLSAILKLAIEKLTQVTGASRGLIWRVIGDQLAVVCEFSSTGTNCFEDTKLGSQESTAIVLEFLSRFPDESGGGVIAVSDTTADTKLHKVSPTLSSLIELGEVKSRLVAQLRCRGLVSGFVELQQCKESRVWRAEDASLTQAVSEILSVVVQQSLDREKIASDAEQMKLINEIADLFRESKGLKSHDMLVKSLRLVADHLGFQQSQIYLHDQKNQKLMPQIADSHGESVPLSDGQSPFVRVFESGHSQLINAEFSRKADMYFGHEMALIVPLVSESEKLGVMCLWQRQPERPELRPQGRELSLAIAGQLASIIRADQAIAQIRSEQSREALINKVFSEIRSSIKEIDHTIEVLVSALQEYFSLALCVVSLYEGDVFCKTKYYPEDNVPSKNIGWINKLFNRAGDDLKKGKIVDVEIGDLKDLLSREFGNEKPVLSSATLVPLLHAGLLKGALALIGSDNKQRLPEKDMTMVADLADRVAVIVSHAQLFAQVEKQAVTDPMTGLYNRRHFADQLSKEIDRYQRFGHPFSYVICDLDYLKKINDNLGHQQGDAAIKHIANVLKNSVRDVDVVARFGGEEFVVLLPETDVAAARVAAERFCLAVREKPVKEIGSITASFGISTYPLDAQDREKLMELADQALYLAKHRGRNRVCSVSEDLIPSMQQHGTEALEIQQAAMKAKADQFASIDLKLLVDYGILGVMGAIVKIIEARDAYTQDRSPRAVEYATKLAEALHLSKEHTTVVLLSAMFNNIGKIAVPEHILRKQGALDEQESKIVKQSPLVGAKILESAKHLYKVAGVIEACREHWDGSGYPKGLKEEGIPLESRIIAIVDVYIAMTSDRPYRKALSNEEAIKAIQAGSGTLWDPRIVKLFLSVLEKQKQ